MVADFGDADRSYRNFPHDADDWLGEDSATIMWAAN